MINPIHLFLLVPNDSGSTWLQNIISLCSNCVSFSTGLDGKGVCRNASAYPNMEINKLFSENPGLWGDPEAFNWEVIKKLWFKEWSASTHTPKVYLEKTPQGIYSSDMYVEQFENVCFIIMIRNPYAVAEGMMRTIGEASLGNVSLQRCIKHWIRCARRQIYNCKTYENISIKITYEELVNQHEEVEQKIKELVPPLHDIDLTKAACAHSLDGMKAKTLIDFNVRQINNLSPKDVVTINRELEKVPEILEYFGYELIYHVAGKENL